MSTDALHLLRLQAWLSPAFPVGGFSYSHGLEQAVELGWVSGRESLLDWLETDLRHGAGRSDAILLAWSHRAASERDAEALLDIAELAAALRGTSELALESTAQGTSFLATVRQAWPHPELEALAGRLAEMGIQAAYPVVVGAACAVHGVPLAPALRFVLHAVVANYVAASLRLLRLGQTDGQRIIAALEDAVVETAAEALTAGLDDVGSASLSVDVASMRHETQYSRLFRS
ncbi:MAG: urease accessory protein UreF [Alphaproteobacteria bacterium]|nr:urease accessory protein UreF [Alphaproteobacteria bacterium]